MQRTKADLIALGKQIRTERQRRGLTIAKAGATIGVGKRTWGAYEVGERLSPKMVYALEHWLVERVVESQRLLCAAYMEKSCRQLQPLGTFTRRV